MYKKIKTNKTPTHHPQKRDKPVPAPNPNVSNPQTTTPNHFSTNKQQSIFFLHNSLEEKKLWYN